MSELAYVVQNSNSRGGEWEREGGYHFWREDTKIVKYHENLNDFILLNTN